MTSRMSSKQPEVFVVEAPKTKKEPESQPVNEIVVVKTIKNQDIKKDASPTNEIQVMNMIPLSTLLEPGDSSDDDSEEESVAVALRDAKADAARLRALLDADDEDHQEERKEKQQEMNTINAPSLDELLQLCVVDDQEVTKENAQHGCFICPDCLMVAPTSQVLQEHFESVHAQTWKEIAGRRQGREGYILGDLSRIVARSLTRAPIRTQRRLQRRLAARRAEAKSWYFITGAATLGIAAAVAGAPLLGTAAIGTGIIQAVSSHHRRTRARILDQHAKHPPEEEDGTELSTLAPPLDCNITRDDDISSPCVADDNNATTASVLLASSSLAS